MKQYITANGVFGSGLLGRVLATLGKTGWRECVEDRRSVIEFEDTELPGYTFRDYQVLALETIKKRKQLIVKAPTGSGKTLIIAGMAQALSAGQGVILFNQKQVLEQTRRFMVDAGMEVGVVTGDCYDPKRITLCTIQSIHKVIDLVTQADWYAVDEVHEFARGKLTLAALNSFPNASYRVGFTATPPKDNYRKTNLEAAMGPVFDVVPMQELISKGTLAKPIIQLVGFEHTKAEIAAAEHLEYLSVYDEFLVRNARRNELVSSICETIRNSGKETKTLILVKHLEHVRLLKELLPGSETVEGKDSIEARYASINHFLAQDHGIIIGTKVFQTGIDIKEITHMLNVRGGKDQIPVIQALGRVVRHDGANDEVYFYDIFDIGIKYLAAHSRGREKTYKKEGHDVSKVIHD